MRKIGYPILEIITSNIRLLWLGTVDPTPVSSSVDDESMVDVTLPKISLPLS
jgi:hypothetical protein